MDFHKLIIKEINKETDKAVSIAFEVPENLKSLYSFKAGQYITLKTQIGGQDIRRDYSLCTAPKSGELKVVVKEVDNGRFSKYANSTLKVGDAIEVSTPNGRFTFEPNVATERTVVAFAAGSGITPIMSIVKAVLLEEPKSKFILVYGNKTPRNTIFYKELLDLYKQYNDRFHLQLVFSKSSENNAFFGRIEPSTVKFALKNNDNAALFYLCGPEPMIHSVSDTLKDLGFSDDAIKFELFTATAEKTPITTEAQDGNTTVTVLVDDEESTFVMPQTKTILESALENDIDAPYSCQGGICSSCIARLTHGEAKMRQNNILTDSELEEGLILTCQAQPTTSSVKVDYDDV